MTAATAPTRTRGPVRQISTVLAATAAAAVIWVVAVPLAGVDLLARPGGGPTQTVGVGAVVGVSLLAGLAGWGLLALLGRVAPRRARRIWTGVASAVLVLSLAGPLSGGVSASGTVTLIVLHLVVGLALIVGLRRATSRTAA